MIYIYIYNNTIIDIEHIINNPQNLVYYWLTKGASDIYIYIYIYIYIKEVYDSY